MVSFIVLLQLVVVTSDLDMGVNVAWVSSLVLCVPWDIPVLLLQYDGLVCCNKYSLSLSYTHTQTHTYIHIYTCSNMLHVHCMPFTRLSYPFSRINPPICISWLYDSPFGYSVSVCMYMCVCLYVCVYVHKSSAVCDRQLNIISAAHTTLLILWPILY